MKIINLLFIKEVERVKVEKYKKVKKSLTYLTKYCSNSEPANLQSELSYLQKTERENQLSTHPSSLLRQVKTMAGAEDDF